jgi:hypothetical protein
VSVSGAPQAAQERSVAERVVPPLPDEEVVVQGDSLPLKASWAPDVAGQEPSLLGHAAERAVPPLPDEKVALQGDSPLLKASRAPDAAEPEPSLPERYVVVQQHDSRPLEALRAPDVAGQGPSLLGHAPARAVPDSLLLGWLVRPQDGWSPS